MLKEIKGLQQQEHDLQEESLSVRLRIEQIETTIADHNNKIKHWQKEVRPDIVTPTCYWVGADKPCAVFQADKLSPHTIGDKPEEELPVLTPEQLEAISDPNVIIGKIMTLETKCSQMKPNLGAIVEYKKKVRRCCLWGQWVEAISPVCSLVQEELYLQRVAQLDDITAERDKFKCAYEDLRKQRFNEFMNGFNMITSKLKENYQMLTLGGDAELELVDSLDPFSEGIMFRCG